MKFYDQLNLMLNYLLKTIVHYNDSLDIGQVYTRLNKCFFGYWWSVSGKLVSATLQNGEGESLNVSLE